jgi:uncharacterized protein with ParB-like and HNH nuclease domain
MMTSASEPVNKTGGHPKTVRELLADAKFGIDYYQREYKWETRHVVSLLDDLSQKFMENFSQQHESEQVRLYPHYFLGSIIVGQKNKQNFIVDGQQRLTTITLLLIYLNNLQNQIGSEKVDVTRLIFSTRYGKNSYNLEIEERVRCMETLFTGQPFDSTGDSLSVQNISARYFGHH